MNIVTYSLAIGSEHVAKVHGKQLLESVKSLRAFNPTVGAHVFAYGDLPSGVLAELGDWDVAVHPMGSYADTIRASRPRAWRRLVDYPVAHKWLIFGEVDKLNPSQVLAIDTDTVFLEDVASLFERYAERKFYAREDTGSRASRVRDVYDPSYLDEDALFAMARQEGAANVPVCNSGVCMLNHGLWKDIEARRDTYLRTMFRLYVGIISDPVRREQLQSRWPDALDMIMKDLAEEPDTRGLSYPSSNLWIVEQVALWITLGSTPDFTHGLFSHRDVMQGGELAEDARSSDPANGILYHYFGVDKDAFLALWNDEETEGAEAEGDHGARE